MIYGDFSDKSVRQAVLLATYSDYDGDFRDNSVRPARPLKRPVPVITGPSLTFGPSIHQSNQPAVAAIHMFTIFHKGDFVKLSITTDLHLLCNLVCYTDLQAIPESTFPLGVW